MDNYFESPFRDITLDKQIINPNIVVGRYSYYSGYYHGHSFEDCARYGSVAKKLRSRRVAHSSCQSGRKALCSLLEHSDSLCYSSRTNTKGPLDNPSFSKDVI